MRSIGRMKGVENLLAVLPSILALGAFVAVIKLVMNSDRLERKAEAELDAQEAEKSRQDEQAG